MLLNAKNSKEYYKPFLKIKNTEMINRIKNNYSSTKNYRKRKHC